MGPLCPRATGDTIIGLPRNTDHFPAESPRIVKLTAENDRCHPLVAGVDDESHPAIERTLFPSLFVFLLAAREKGQTNAKPAKNVLSGLAWSVRQKIHQDTLDTEGPFGEVP